MNAVAEKGVAFRDWYDRNALPIIGLTLALTLAALIIGVIGTFVNGQQNADRAADNRRRDEQAAAVSAAQQTLLDCFDAYANASSSSSKAVRDASVLKDNATKEFNRTLNVEGLAFKRLIGGIIEQTVSPADVQNLYDTLDARAKAGRQLDRAQDALDQAREDNPVPDPPSEFCAND